MLQNPCKTLGFKKNMVYKIPPGGEVNHIQPVAYYPRGENRHLGTNELDSSSEIYAVSLGFERGTGLQFFIAC